MVLPLYLAQTAAEMAGNPLSQNMAYMACHFAPGGKGLSNLPEELPSGAMLILDDSTPMDDHKPELIAKQLSEIITLHHCEALLLDFQRREIPGQQKLSELLAGALPCPVGVSELYAGDLPCPVFLSPVPPDRPLGTHLAPWQGRELWLEAALEGITLTLTEAGCAASALADIPEDGLTDEKLHCRYTIETTENSAIFRLWRTYPELDDLLAEAQTAGVTKAIGLWQELGR